MMQHTQILNFLTVLISSTFLSVPSFGIEPSSPLKVQEAKEDKTTQESEETISLEETLEHTYMQNADLDAARAGLRVTDESVSQANADWRPSLSVQGQHQQQQTYPIGANTRESNPRAQNNHTSYAATLAQNIYKGGATVANIGKAESSVLAGKANLFSTEQDTLFKGVSAHEGVLATRDIVNYQKQSVDFNKKLVDRAQARFEVGAISRTEVAAAEANLEGANASLSQAIGNFETAKATYLQIVGSVPGKLAPSNIIIPIPDTYEAVLEEAKAHNPTITQARYQLEAAQYNVDAQMAGLLPQLDVQGQVGNNRDGGASISHHIKQTSLSAAAILNVPIYKQGIPSSQVRQAYQQVAQSKVQLVSAQRGIVQQATSAWDALLAAREAVKSFIAQVKAQELALEGGMEEFNVGSISAIDVIELQQNLVEAQIQLVNAQQTLVTATYAVLQAMGRLTARDLRLNVKYYDPDTYFNEYKDAWIQFWQGSDLRYVREGEEK